VTESSRSGIAHTLERYAWAYDKNGSDGIGECFTSDAHVFFPRVGLKIGREEVAAELRRRRSTHPVEMPWHVISNAYITDAAPQQATVKSRYAFFLQPPDGIAQFVSVGWYDDVFVVDGGLWRIKHRRVLRPHDR
jgi:hypothetical protein